MNSIWNWLIFLLAAAAITISIINLSHASQLKTQLNNSIELSRLINNKYDKDSTNILDSLRNEIVQLNFEKESYLTNMGLKSDWAILYVTVLFGIFGLVGYTFFIAKINETFEKNNSENKKTSSRLNDFNVEFSQLKVNQLHTSANLYATIALSFENNLPFALWARIEAAKSIKMMIDIDGSSNNLEKTILRHLTKANSIIDELNSEPDLLILHFENVPENFESMTESFENLLGIKNVDSKLICAQIFAKFIAMTKGNFPKK